MIVVAIIGILAAIAIPNFIKFQCRSKQSEAKGNLKAMYVAEESYRGENDSYQVVATIGPGTAGATSNTIGFQPKGAKIRYAYTAGVTSSTNFLGTATGNGEMKTDGWKITENNDLSQDTIRGCD